MEPASARNSRGVGGEARSQSVRMPSMLAVTVTPPALLIKSGHVGGGGGDSQAAFDGGPRQRLGGGRVFTLRGQCGRGVLLRIGTAGKSRGGSFGSLSWGRRFPACLAEERPGRWPRMQPGCSGWPKPRKMCRAQWGLSRWEVGHVTRHPALSTLNEGHVPHGGKRSWGGGKMSEEANPELAGTSQRRMRGTIAAY